MPRGSIPLFLTNFAGPFITKRVPQIGYSSSVYTQDGRGGRWKPSRIVSASISFAMAGIAVSCSTLIPKSICLIPTGKQSRWRSLRVRAEVKYVNSEDAKQLVATEGYTVLDVRDRFQFERAHIKSCRHVPLFVENQDNDVGTIIKRQLHNNFSGLLYGLPFTKLNAEFVEAVKRELSPESKVLVVCQEGLRSAGAAKKLEEAGFKNIVCITSGLQSVKPGMFETEGSTELKDAGKAGLVTIQGKISAVLVAYLFITFFPDQAEKLLQLAPTG